MAQRRGGTCQADGARSTAARTFFTPTWLIWIPAAVILSAMVRSARP